MGKKSGVRKKRKVGLVWSGLVKDISNLGLHQIKYIHISYLQSRCMENFIQIAVPLKHPEDTYILTHNPEFSGLIVRLYSLEVHWYLYFNKLLKLYCLEFVSTPPKGLMISKTSKQPATLKKKSPFNPLPLHWLLFL